MRTRNKIRIATLIKPLLFLFLFSLTVARAAEEENDSKGYLKSCKGKQEKFRALDVALQTSTEIPQECRQALEKAKALCQAEPKNEGLPEAEGGGLNRAAALTVKATELARDKYRDNKKNCDDASQPMADICAEFLRQLNEQRRAAQDEPERATLLKKLEQIRDARRAAIEASESSSRCSNGYAQIYDEALEISKETAELTDDGTPDAPADPAINKAAKILAKDVAKEALKNFGKEVSKLVPGATAAIEAYDGNPAGAAKELGKELIPLRRVGKVVEKAASIALAPSPISRCGDILTPVQAYRFGCTAYIPQSATAAIEILSQD